MSTTITPEQIAQYRAEYEEPRAKLAGYSLNAWLGIPAHEREKIVRRREQIEYFKANPKPKKTQAKPVKSVEPVKTQAKTQAKPVTAVKPARVKKHASEAERKAAHRESQAKWDAKNPPDTEQEEKQRVAKQVWAATNRATKRAAKAAKLERDQAALFSCWLACWVVGVVSCGGRLPRRTI